MTLCLVTDLVDGPANLLAANVAKSAKLIARNGDRADNYSCREATRRKSMSVRLCKPIGAASLAGMLALSMLGCSSKLSEPEPIPEVVVNDLARKENVLWNAFKQKDRPQLDRVLSYDYMTVNDRGPMDKETKIASIADQTITDFSIHDLRATLLGSNYVLLTYRCRSRGEREGRAFDEDYLCSDIWISRGGAWQSIFFEDRPVTDQPATALRR
jgi:hypothetical protein